MIQHRDYVRVEKIGSSANPDVRTPHSDEYVPGGGILNRDMSLPIDYVMTGLVVDPPEVDKCFTMYRDTRNGIKVLGTLQTTRIVRVTEENDVTVIIETRNSIYRITKIPLPQRSESGESSWPGGC